MLSQNPKSISNPRWNSVVIAPWPLLTWNIPSAFLQLSWHWHFCGQQARWFLECLSICLIFLNFEKALKGSYELPVSPAFSLLRSSFTLTSVPIILPRLLLFRSPVTFMSQNSMASSQSFIQPLNTVLWSVSPTSWRVAHLLTRLLLWPPPCPPTSGPCGAFAFTSSFLLGLHSAMWPILVLRPLGFPHLFSSSLLN